MSGPETITLAGLPRGQLEALTEQLLAEKAALKQAVAELRAEVASLKGLKGRPRMKPSGMDQATEPGFAAKGQGRGAKGSKSERLRVDKEQVIKAAVPAGSRFKGYQDFLIQDLVLRPCVVRIRRERWLTPDGRTVVAPLPAGIVGHFGPELRRFALFPYHQGQVTVPRLVAQLGAVGIAISKRRVVRLLDEGQGIFLDAARDVLRAGLATAPLPAPSSRRPSAARTGSSSAVVPGSPSSTACSHGCTRTSKSRCWCWTGRPEIALPTNGSERDLRPQVVKRKLSGGTRSDDGRDCRDAFLGLLQTCAKLGVSFWNYLGHRFGVPGAEAPYRPDLVRLRSAPA